MDPSPITGAAGAGLPEDGQLPAGRPVASSIADILLWLLLTPEAQPVLSRLRDLSAHQGARREVASLLRDLAQQLDTLPGAPEVGTTSGAPVERVPDGVRGPRAAGADRERPRIANRAAEYAQPSASRPGATSAPADEQGEGTIVSVPADATITPDNAEWQRSRLKYFAQAMTAETVDADEAHQLLQALDSHLPDDLLACRRGMTGDDVADPSPADAPPSGQPPAPASIADAYGALRRTSAASELRFIDTVLEQVESKKAAAHELGFSGASSLESRRRACVRAVKSPWPRPRRT